MQVPTLPVCPARQVQIILAYQVLQVRPWSRAEGVTPGEMWEQRKGGRGEQGGGVTLDVVMDLSLCFRRSGNHQRMSFGY